MMRNLALLPVALVLAACSSPSNTLARPASVSPHELAPRESAPRTEPSGGLLAPTEGGTAGPVRLRELVRFDGEIAMNVLGNAREVQGALALLGMRDPNVDYDVTREMLRG